MFESLAFSSAYVATPVTLTLFSSPSTTLDNVPVLLAITAPSASTSFVVPSYVLLIASNDAVSTLLFIVPLPVTLASESI